MKKFYTDPELELIEIDSLVSTWDVSETGAEPGQGGADEDVTNLWDEGNN